MQDDYVYPEISAEEWEKEIGELTVTSGQRELDVLVRWQSGYLRANTSLAVVHEKTQLQILLQRQFDSGHSDGYIDISLPTGDPSLLGRYEKHVGQRDEIALRLLVEIPPRRDDPGGAQAWTEVYLSTSPELLQLVIGEGPNQ